jgi:electron transfer flavoprotein beta subunit
VRIVVLTKHVPQAIGEVSFAADLTVDRAAVRCRLEDSDEYAVEQAMRVAARRLDVQVIALTMGPAGAVAALRTALALGADEAVHILDDALHGCDALATSLVLASACAKLGFDIVLCGTASADSGMSVVPAMLAERLGVPALCFADALRTDEDEVVVDRDDGRAVEELTATMPVVVSMTDRSGEPRYPRFEAIAEARQKLVRTWSLADLGIAPDRVGLAAAATVVMKVTKAVPAVTRDAGPAQTVAGGDPRAAAERIADFLAERQFL